MSSSANILGVYKDLADGYERRGQAQMRDRFLVLAADAALAAGQPEEAENLRKRLLQVNPDHMLKPYASFELARRSSDVDTYVRNLRLNYPLEVASDLLRALQAGEDPTLQQMQKTAPTPAGREEPTLDADNPVFRTAATAWEPAGAEEPDSTLAMPTPATPPPRSTRNRSDLDETEHLPGAGSPRPRAPTRPDVERTELASRPPAPRSTAPAPRIAAPASPPTPRPKAPGPAPKPSVPKAAPRPAPGASPFAASPHEAAPPARPRRPQPVEEPPGDNGWMGNVLLVVVSVIGAGVLAYTIARPFLPKEWLP